MPRPQGSGHPLAPRRAPEEQRRGRAWPRRAPRHQPAGPRRPKRAQSRQHVCVGIDELEVNYSLNELFQQGVVIKRLAISKLTVVAGREADGLYSSTATR